MSLIGLFGLGTLATISAVVLVFVVIAVAVAPRGNPREPGRGETLSLQDLEDDASS